MFCSIPIMTLEFPLFAKWYITGKCNLRCAHCYLTDFTKQAPLEHVLEIIRYLATKKLRHISFLGGEPLVRDDLEHIVKECSVCGIYTKLATNGTLIDDGRVKSLKKAGLQSFQVSLEGHSPELSDSVRGKGTFDLAMKAISILKHNDIWASMSLTLSHENVGSIDQIFKKADSAGVDELKLAAFVPVGTGAFDAKTFMLDEKDIGFIRDEIT